MLELLRRPSRSAAGAILYVTIGTLMVIWAGLWYWYFLMPQQNPPALQRFMCVGIILSGFSIGIIGLLFGQIGREAKLADNAVGVASASPGVSVVAGGVMPPVVMGEPIASAVPTAAVPIAGSPPSVATTASPRPIREVARAEQLSR